jgi:hypothetical protein
MEKKAVTHVAAFLLFGGAIKIISNDINVKIVDSFILDVMRVSDMINISFGLNAGFFINKPLKVLAKIAATV